jgi:hypothetical protein
MWSSFMDLDEAQARSSGAEARLEKPFDVETLRKQVLELVPKTRSQRLAHFLEFSPRLNQELIEDPNAKAPAASPATAAPSPTAPPPASDLGARLAARAASPKAGPPPAAAPKPASAAPAPSAAAPPADAAKSSWSMESFEEPSSFEDEEFQPLELSQLSRDPGESAESENQSAFAAGSDAGLDADDETWSRQDLSQFKLDLPPISVGEGAGEFKIDMGEEEFSTPNFETVEETAPAPIAPPEDTFGNDLTLDAHQINQAVEEIPLPLEPVDEGGLELTKSGADLLSPSDEPPRTQQRTPPAPHSAGAAQLSAEQLEHIIRSQSREIIERVVRKLVPDLAATIIREELERLLEDTAVRESGGRGGKDNRL